MANNLVTAGLRIAASATGLGIFGGIKSSLSGLSKVTSDLRLKQKELGDLMQRNMGTLAPQTLAALNRDYVKLGQTIDSLSAKQERLNERLARRETLRGQRSELRGQMLETGATAAAIGAPLIASVGRSMNFESELRDMSITAGFSKAEEASLGDAIRASSTRWNAFTGQVLEGMQKLTAGGIQEVQALERYAPVIAKAVTATGAGASDLGNVLLAMRRNLDISEDQSEAALNMLVYSGKQGAFEIRDMAKWIPALAPMLASLGFKGKAAVAELGAALQVAEIGAGSTDQAANNFRNFLNKITAPDTLKDFAKAGIDLQDSLMRLRAQGLSPVEGMLQIITTYMSSKGPKAMAEFKSAVKLEDNNARDAALSQLSSAYGLGELFQDQEVMAFIRPAMANLEQFKKNRDGALQTGNQDLMGADWVKRMDTANSRMDAFKIGIGELGLSLGNALLPAVNDLLKTVIPLVHSVASWAKENPNLVSGIVKIAAGVVTLRMGMLGAAYALNLGASGLNGLGIAMSLASGKASVLSHLLTGTRFAPLVAGISNLSGMVGVLGGVIAATPIGWLIAGVAGIAAAGLLVYKYWEPIKAWAGGFFTGLMEGLKPVGDAFTTAFSPLGPLFSAIGSALRPVIQWFRELFTPVEMSGDALGRAGWSGMQFGRTVGAVLSGLLTPLRWVLEGIGEIPKAFSGGLGGVAALIANFSPLGMFYRAFSGVMSYFGVELPAKFTDFGGMLITGLVNGIQGMAGAAKDAVVGLGDDVTGWFKDKLGIQSPSRVFMAAGANVAEGAALGITGQSGMVRKAALGMAAATAVPLGTPQFAAADLAALTNFGGMLVTGLVNGIQGMAGAAKDAVVGLGDDVTGWFKDKLGIQSPSRVFMAAGANVAEGAALGISGQSGMVRKAALGMAAATAVTLGAPQLAAADLAASTRSAALAGQGQAGGMTINLTQNFTINDASGKNLEAQARQMAEISYREFERLLERAEYNRKRRSF